VHGPRSDGIGATGEAHRSGSLGLIGFSSRSDVYERGRPGYPPELIEMLAEVAGLGPGCRALDLAAGTGKLTRQLQAAGAQCVAVEPSTTMREVSGRVVGGLCLVGGTAEALPLTSGSFDLVTVAQAFHWFEPATALPEMARVLRREGTAALVWNERDDRIAWVAELGQILLMADRAPHRAGAEFLSVLESEGTFAPVTRHRFPFAVAMERTELVDLVASRSYVNILGADERVGLLSRVEALAATLDEPLVMPYVTEVLVGQMAKTR
jgi:SAM-dependent methyltransferase